MTGGDQSVDKWTQHLVNEARRDVVFMFNLASGAFGGQALTIDDSMLRRAIEVLLRSGGRVGFGDPDTSSWQPVNQFDGLSPEIRAQRIVQAWRKDPRNFDALAFAIRG